ncbi:cytochrome C [Roseateles aquatilis]|uniref:Cytochrome C n=1 Tax=Roseateles aquatilis TaxID=431061 RepID=A0A246JKX1_9BURK|nr:c-type cytochrome [Roseateles aquatilis]OWQ93190.1 cytochrome C [Roseateles aquatilis]
MKHWIRRGLFGLATLAFLAGAGALAAVQMADTKMNRRIEVAGRDLHIPQDAKSLERGRYLYATRGCVDCHGANGAGRRFIDADGMRVAGPNLTAGPGSVTLGYTPSDWDRTLRHGVKPDGRPLLIMPSQDYNRLTDEDVGALVAYVQSMPQASGGPAEMQLPLPVRVLYGLGQIPDAASRINHDLPPEPPVPAGQTVAHGRYLAAMCIGCHGEKLQGGRIAGAPPSWPSAADLDDPLGVMASRYGDAAAFAAMMRSGKRPDGSGIAVMPFESLRELSDDDIAALHRYIRLRGTQVASGD